MSKGDWTGCKEAWTYDLTGARRSTSEDFVCPPYFVRVFFCEMASDEVVDGKFDRLLWRHAYQLR